jgi:dihydroorotase-like cyclic amidohydrolase
MSAQLIESLKQFSDRKLNIALQGFSSSHALSLIADLKKHAYSNLYTDLSVPFLYFDADMIAEGQTIFKSDPPIRAKNSKYLL